MSILGSLLLLSFLALSALTVFRGMTRREELFYQASANAATLRVTLSSIGDAVIATDLSARITFINQVAQNLTGWTEAEALGVPISTVFGSSMSRPEPAWRIQSTKRWRAAA